MSRYHDNRSHSAGRSGSHQGPYGEPMALYVQPSNTLGSSGPVISLVAPHEMTIVFSSLENAPTMYSDHTPSAFRDVASAGPPHAVYGSAYSMRTPSAADYQGVRSLDNAYARPVSNPWPLSQNQEIHARRMSTAPSGRNFYHQGFGTGLTDEHHQPDTRPTHAYSPPVLQTAQEPINVYDYQVDVDPRSVPSTPRALTPHKGPIPPSVLESHLQRVTPRRPAVESVSGSDARPYGQTLSRRGSADSFVTNPHDPQDAVLLTPDTDESAQARKWTYVPAGYPTTTRDQSRRLEEPLQNETHRRHKGGEWRTTGSHTADDMTQGRSARTRFKRDSLEPSQSHYDGDSATGGHVLQGPPGGRHTHASASAGGINETDSKPVTMAELHSAVATAVTKALQGLDLHSVQPSV